MQDSIAHIEQVARLTNIKDRDTTDAALAEVLLSLLEADAVGIYEVLSVQGRQVCLTRAFIATGMVAPASTPSWTDAADCPPLEQFPWRVPAVRSHHPHLAHDGSDTVLTVPVVTDSDTVLLLEVRTRRLMRDGAVAMVQGIGKVYRNFCNLLDYSERDTLTALLNRKSFDETFYKLTTLLQTGREAPQASEVDELGQRGLPQAQAYWLGVIDVDHFKQVNDRFGHLIGDEVLLLVARIMRSTFRHEDRLYRFGGEEFVVLLRAEDVGHVRVVFERFRQHMQTYHFPQVGQVTISLGFTEIRASDTPSSAFERADKAVYYAKAHGRNRVIDYADLVAQGQVQESAGRNEIELF